MLVMSRACALHFIILSKDFHAFSAAHFVALAVFIVGAMALVYARRRKQRSIAIAREAASLDRALGILAIAAWVFSIGTDLLPSRFDIGGSLPLQLCDLAGVAAPIALLTNQRWARTLLHYWGLGLSTQAMITPTLAEGPATITFWTFWAGHFAVVGSAIYDLFARGYRPTWNDFRIVALFAAAYLPLVLLVDLPFGLNYGFVGNTNPDRPTVLDLLGPWPERIFVIWFVVAGLLFGMTWPWELYRYFRGRRRDSQQITQSFSSSSSSSSFST